MKKSKIILMIIISALLFSSCINTPDSGSSVSSDRIHIVGDYGIWKTAFYWHDGDLTVLDEPAGDFHVFASSVTVSNGKVYVGGGYESKPCYWVDGVRHVLDGGTGSYSDDITGIAVDVEGRLILAGSCNDEASVWVAGVRAELEVPAGDRGVVKAMTVFGDVIYVAGYCTDDLSDETPCYWKDGTRHELPESMTIASGGSVTPYDIAVDGAAVYIAGTYDAEDPDDDKAGAGYWCDGVWTDLDGTSARAITISGNKVCIAGRDSDGPCFWMDEDKSSLEGCTSPQIVTAVASSGSAFVAAGECGDYGQDDTLGYWSGGEFFQIYEAAVADVNGICITE